MPSSDVRSSETSAQNARGKNFQKFTCSNFRGFVFRSSYFSVLVVSRENRENLDLTKISRYTGTILPMLPIDADLNWDLCNFFNVEMLHPTLCLCSCVVEGLPGRL